MNPPPLLGILPGFLLAIVPVVMASMVFIDHPELLGRHDTLVFLVRCAAGLTYAGVAASLSGRRPLAWLWVLVALAWIIDQDAELFVFGPAFVSTWIYAQRVRGRPVARYVVGGSLVFQLVTWHPFIVAGSPRSYRRLHEDFAEVFWPWSVFAVEEVQTFIAVLWYASLAVTVLLPTLWGLDYIVWALRNHRDSLQRHA